jgi:ribosomal protein S18 acetylase RimI-like enzyme
MTREIRRLGADDAAEYRRLRREALDESPSAFGEDAEEHRRTTLDDVARRLGTAGDDAFVLGAFEEGVLVGTAGFARFERKKTRHKGRVWGVFVAPSARRRGVGRALVAALLGRAARIDGVQQVVLSVAATQEPARRLYTALGFVTYGREPRALRVGGRDIDEELMVAMLEPMPARDPE